MNAWHIYHFLIDEASYDELKLTYKGQRSHSIKGKASPCNNSCPIELAFGKKILFLFSNCASNTYTHQDHLSSIFFHQKKLPGAIDRPKSLSLERMINVAFYVRLIVEV